VVTAADVYAWINHSSKLALLLHLLAEAHLVLEAAMHTAELAKMLLTSAWFTLPSCLLDPGLMRAMTFLLGRLLACIQVRQKFEPGSMSIRSSIGEEGSSSIAASDSSGSSGGSNTGAVFYSSPLVAKTVADTGEAANWGWCRHFLAGE
jgi:hypothetical protein